MVNLIANNERVQLDTAADSLAPPERGEVGARGFELAKNG